MSQKDKKTATKEYKVLDGIWQEQLAKHQDHFGRVDFDFGNLLSICSEFHARMKEVQD